MGLFKNIITFGAAGRVESKIEEFEDLHQDYKRLHSRMESKRTKVNESFEQLIQVKVSAVQSLKQISTLSENLRGKEREFVYNTIDGEVSTLQFDRIEATISAADVAMDLTKGVTAGVSTALGAWALVSTIGTASTGTAIGALSGAAATNATLAWFGGGALAAGGGGMAAGTAVLGGIVAIPALVLTGVFSHLKANKQIKEIEAKMVKLLESIDQLHANILHLDLLGQRTAELIQAIEKAQATFDHEIKHVHKQLYPIPFFSKLRKTLRNKLLKRDYFSKQDLQHIAYIGGLANEFATLIDTKVFD